VKKFRETLLDSDFPGWETGDGTFVGAIFCDIESLKEKVGASVRYDCGTPYMWGVIEGVRYTIIQEKGDTVLEAFFEGGLSDKHYRYLFDLVSSFFPEFISRIDIYRNNPKNLPR